MTLLITFTILFIIIYIAFKTWIESKISKPWLRNSIDIVLVVIIIPICVSLIMPLFQKEEQKKEDRFRKLVLDAIVEKKMSTEDINLILKEKYRIFYNTTGQEAERWARNFAKNINEKKNELESLKLKEVDLGDRLSLRWKPFLEYLLQEFDLRISAIEKYKSTISKSQEPYRIVVYDEPRVFQVREINFPNGYRLTVNYFSARIANGELFETPVLEFLVGKQGQGMVTAFQIKFLESEFRLSFGDARYKNIVEQNLVTKIDPMLDTDFRQGVVNSISRFIELIFIRGDSNIK